MRSDWSDLPREIRGGIAAHTGRIDRIEPAPTGNHADLASTLYTADGPVFVKAARKQGDQDGPEVRSLRWEAAINPHVNEFAPRLLWQAEAGGWLALGFEHVRGRHADFTPGSADLELLAKVIQTFQGMQAPEVLAGKRVERRWESVADDVSPLAGHTLLHSDLNPANLLIADDGRVRVVDWAFAARGAAFVELALVVPWLLKAGHSPAQAEAWVSRFSSWADADSAHIDLFARVFADKWRINLAFHGNAAWAVEHAAAARRWADYRTR
ncbi:Phosphotransferase enzyme family protein [Thermomonospora echinospora]|uniref:Phosphotransferase enzyme family protein n=1 Tax=Thermomonospora echinospora TaxID=1992 RepID=A0A1H5Z426_9ACTN|nr:phosphotransferase [Thermomonospora echinospora]SEG31263.1 Phosphotransferase enzyme family protein [Thermomonospora echinospora]